MSNSLGQRIRRARQREGLTQEALGQKVGVKQATVAVWEGGGGLTAANRKKLEEVLGPLTIKRGAKVVAVPDTEVSSFGVWLRDQRSKASMSVPELSKASGVSAPAIYNLEGGKI